MFYIIHVFNIAGEYPKAERFLKISSLIFAEQ